MCLRPWEPTFVFLVLFYNMLENSFFNLCLKPPPPAHQPISLWRKLKLQTSCLGKHCGSLCMGTNYFKPLAFVVLCLLGRASLPRQVATGLLLLGTQTRVGSTITYLVRGARLYVWCYHHIANHTWCQILTVSFEEVNIWMNLKGKIYTQLSNLMLTRVVRISLTGE